MMKMSLYLAGPIFGCDKPEANDWRRYVADKLKEHNIIGISPLRCEPIEGERYGHGNDSDPRFGTARAIGSKNFFDVQRCDLTFAYFPEQKEKVLFEEWDHELNLLRMPSLGTVCEVAWAYALRKPAIVVTNDKRIANHPVINSCAGWLLPTLEDGIDTAIGILGGYVGGKTI